jgi:hypothetical protein
MNSKKFVIWLSGFAAATNKSITQEQWNTLKDKLSQVHEDIFEDDDSIATEWEYEYNKMPNYSGGSLNVTGSINTPGIISSINTPGTTSITYRGSAPGNIIYSTGDNKTLLKG